MPLETRIVQSGPQQRVVRAANGTLLSVPPSWALLPPGDAGLTRRVKTSGPTWTVREKRGRKLFSLGVWADAARIAEHRAALETERATPQYAKRLAAGAKRRATVQNEYETDFQAAVLAFLNFAPAFVDLAEQLAVAVTRHATPVGSGTVARTQRIPVEQRAEAAVIAWLRHQTTAYDTMRIPRQKGKRREVRRMLAEHSRGLLGKYRAGTALPDAKCPLRLALTSDHAPHAD